MPRLVRRSENQKLFREVNERIAELSTTHDTRNEPQSFFCECARVGCREMIEVPLRIYAIVRENDLYIVLPGHQDPTHEQTVTDHDEFLIVRTLRKEPSLTAASALRPTGGV